MGKFNFDMKIQIMDVTPEMAKRWLERNTENRNVNHARVKAIARDIKDGHWDCTHQGIAIASDGTLVDGQHRLMAIVQANKTVRVPVAMNAPKSTHIDSGAIRSLTNRIQMGTNGLDWVNKNTTAAVRVINSMFSSLHLTNEETLREWLNAYKIQVQGAMSCVKHTSVPNLGSSGISAGFITALINGVPEQYLHDFAEVMYSSYAQKPQDIYPISLRDEISKYKKNPASGTLQRYAYVRTCHRVNQYYCAATGQKFAKRVVDSTFPYSLPDAQGHVVYRKGKLTQ